MNVVHFIYITTDHSEAPPATLQIEQVNAIIAGIEGLARGLIFSPAVARDYYTDDGPSPALALQLYYSDLPALEAAAAAQGPLQALNDLFPAARIEHQAMLVRPFPVDEPLCHTELPADACAYLVHYPGKAEDFNAWLGYYLEHHPQIMRTFPGIRNIEIYTRVDWQDALPWTPVHHMQRNRLVFNSPAELENALNSSVRHDMRADFERFPPFTGSNIHYPMLMKAISKEKAF